MTNKHRVRQRMRSSLLDRIRHNPREARLFSVSKRKVFVRLGKQSMVLRDNDPLVAQIQQIIDVYREEAHTAHRPTLANNKVADRKARHLLREIVQRHSCLCFEDKKVIVESVNGRRYAICLEKGTVYHWDKRRWGFVCVVASRLYPGGGVLPFADCIIAMALTIAYAPHLIGTL